MGGGSREWEGAAAPPMTWPIFCINVKSNPIECTKNNHFQAKMHFLSGEGGSPPPIIKFWNRIDCYQSMQVAVNKRIGCVLLILRSKCVKITHADRERYGVLWMMDVLWIVLQFWRRLRSIVAECASTIWRDLWFVDCISEACTQYDVAWWCVAVTHDWAASTTSQHQYSSRGWLGRI